MGQEALTNAVKHAQAKEIVVYLSFDQGHVRLQVCDDGRGFHLDLSSAGRFGILGMRERAERAGATLTILSSPGGGTEVDMNIPIPPVKAPGQENPVT